jgi:hypothetical protein
MIENEEALISAVDAAIVDCLKTSDSNSNHVTIPVRSAARAIAATTAASEDDFPHILQLVCQRSIRRGHVLAFRSP